MENNTITTSLEAINKDKLKKAVRKNMILLLLGQSVSLFGTSIYTFAISLYILSTTGSGLSFSLSLALGALPGVLFSPISGVVADRFDRKKMVVVMDILSGLVVTGLLVLSVFTELKLIYIYVTTFLLATCSIFFNTSLFSALPNIVDEENLTRINSLSETISSAASIAGPFVGGLIYAIIDIKLFLLVNGLSFIISGISEIFIDFEIRSRYLGSEESGGLEDKNLDEKSILGDLKEGISYIISQKWLMVYGFLAVFLNMLIKMGLSVPIPYIVRELWGFTSQQFGILNTMFPLGMLVGSIILSVLPQPKKNYKRLAFCLIFFSTLVILVGVVISEKLFVMENEQYLIILMALFILIAVTTVFINVPITVTMQRLIPDEIRGRVAGALGTLAMGFSPLGAILGGVLVDALSGPWLLPMGCGIVMLIFTIVMLNNKHLKGI